MECCYDSQPFFHLGSDIILSCCGVQQGEPLGALGIALTLQPIVECILAEVPGLHLNAWYMYLDDGSLCGSPNDIAAAVKSLRKMVPAWVYILTGLSHSSSFLQPLTPPLTHFHLKFLSPGLASPFLVAL